MDDISSRPEIDFLLLADRAEALNGKLYIMGGAWDQLGVVDFRQPAAFSIAIGVIVPWTATGQQHTLDLVLQDEDGKVLAPLRAGFIAERGANVRQGTAQRLVLAINGMFLLPGPGTYALVGSVNGHESRRTNFTAEQVPTQQQETQA